MVTPSNNFQQETRRLGSGVSNHVLLFHELSLGKRLTRRDEPQPPQISRQVYVCTEPTPNFLLPSVGLRLLSSWLPGRVRLVQFRPMSSVVVAVSQEGKSEDPVVAEVSLLLH